MSHGRLGRQGLPEVQEAGGHEVVLGLLLLARLDLGNLGLRLAGALERSGLGPFRVRGSAVVGVRGSHQGGVVCL